MKLFAFVKGLPFPLWIHLFTLKSYFLFFITETAETFNQDLILKQTFIQRYGIEPSPLNAPYIYYAVSSLINNNATSVTENS